MKAKINAKHKPVMQEIKQQEPLWRPTPRQTTALIRNEFEILYGGARGGGKTDAGMAWLLYDIANPRLRCLVIRRNADDLRDWVDRARVMYRGTGATFAGNPAEIRFPSGAIVRTGHLNDDNAYEKYQGHEYQRILIEELTQITREESYLKLIASCRSTVEGLKAQVFATTNPGGAGHKWTKKRFIDCAPATTTFTDHQSGRTRIFIPALVQDNPHLMQKDPGYIGFLNSLPESLRKQWKDGSWDDTQVDGSYYGELLFKAMQEQRITNVPLEVTMPVHTWWDLGVHDSTAIWFFQFIGNEIRAIDYYENQGEGLPFYIKYLQDKGYIWGDHWAPHDIEVKEFSSGKTRWETAKSLGVNFKIVPKLSLEDGIDAVRAVMNKCYFDAKKCEQGIDALRNYHKEYDEKHAVFKSHPAHDWSSHSADSFRYFAVSHKTAVKSDMRFPTRENDFDRYAVL